MLTEINAVSVLLMLIFILPLISGAYGMFSREEIKYSLGSLLDNIELAVGIVFSVYLSKRIFFEHDGSFFSKIYEAIPDKIKGMFSGQDILVYILAVPVILLLLLLVIRFVTTPLYRYVIIPLSERIYSAVTSSGPALKRISGALWQLPKAVLYTIVFSLLLNFSMYYIYFPPLSKWTSESKEYQFIYKNILYPVLNSNIAKRIPVLVNDSFRHFIPQDNAPALDEAPKNRSQGGIGVIEYFNGVTLDEAVKSEKQINDAALKITGSEKDDIKKAYLIYKWICKNIKYDYTKAENIVNRRVEVTSGSIVAFETRKGICFDYSCLFVSMCRAAGLKVRLVTGVGYSGIAWGDHAWNQVWYPAENRWVNVDATFGSMGVNYFDKRDFSVDHRYADVQGEW